MSKIRKMVEAKQKDIIDNYIFLVDIQKELRWDRSNMRRFVIRHQIPTKKLLCRDNNRFCLAVTKDNAKKLLKLKFEGDNE